MATAKRLPSGQYRALVYSHTENGKRKYESFTAPTKAEAEMKAAKFANNKQRRANYDLTVGEAIDGYIQAKEGVLSPGTIRGYDRMRRCNFASIEQKKVRSLTSEDVQLFISELSKEQSPKTVKNIYGLLKPSLALYAPDLTFRVTLPARQKKRPVSPAVDDVRALYENASDDVKIRVALAVLGLRRGEICAVKYEDINGDMLHVHADIIQDKNNNWVYKDHTKTVDGDRYVKLPPKVKEIIGTGTGYIVKCNPPAITSSFTRLRKKVGVNKRLHDMRHFFASTAAVLGIPDIYTADMGGWNRNSKVLKEVYQNNLDAMSDYYSDMMADHIDGIL